jgi:aminoglycoside 3-N-acetyltransferase
MIYFAHTDFYNFFLNYLKKKKNVSNKKDILKKMLNELLVISKKKLIVPTYNYNFPKNKIFNIQRDQSHIGTFSEMFRKRYSNSRSITPMFSTCSTIKNLNFNSKKTIFDPFGLNSEFDFLVKNNGKILNFGSLFAPTFIMYIERSSKHGALYRYGKFFKGKIYSKKKYIQCKLYFEVRPLTIDIQYDLKKIKKDLIKLKILIKKRTINNFVYEEIDAKQFLIYGLKKLKKNPYFFLKKNTIFALKKKKLFNFKKFKIEEFE